ncbi:hypothetical protein ACJ5NV_08350 [Loktanella agnita]|uniref:hypothetical protein n=1 Tax=Loktanella agnita TaxID=287097 RepID=UPI00398893CC
MADRQRSQDGKKETEEAIENTDRNTGVPGAHGNGEDRDQGQTGVSHVRQKHEEIPKTKELDND